MWLKNFFKSLNSTGGGASGRPRSRSRLPRRSSYSPVLEALEDRMLPSATLSLVGNQTLVANTNVNVSDSFLSNESEMVVDINPTNPLNVVGFVHDTNNLNQIQVFFSTDGGSSWALRVITNTAGAGLRPNSLPFTSINDLFGSGTRFDPSIKFDAGGNLYVAYGMNNAAPIFNAAGTLTGWTTGTTRLVVAMSADGGNTFTRFTTVDTQNNIPRPNDAMGNPVRPGVGLDKWHLASGPSGPNTTTQAVYVAYWDIQNNRNLVAGTRDAAASFTSPIRFDDTNNVGSFASPGVGPNGQLYVTWNSGSRILVDRDLDGLWSNTQSFGTDVTVSHLARFFGARIGVPAQPRRGITNGPVLDVDRSNTFNGRIYIAFMDGFSDPTPAAETDIYLVWSDNQGATWTPTFEGGDRGNVQGTNSTDFLPWVAVDQDTGTVNVAYYTTQGAPDNTQVNLRLASSRNGGASFRKTNVTTRTSRASSMEPMNAMANEFLEYIGLAVRDGTAHAFWADNRGIVPGTFNADTESRWATVATVSAANTLRIDGDDGGLTRNDVITLRTHPNNSDFAWVIVNGQTQWTGLWASVGKVVINGWGGHDTINIENVPAGIPVTVNGGFGDDTMNVSSVAQDLSNIEGDLTLNGGNGRNNLVINDQAYAFRNTYYITGTSVQRGRPSSPFSFPTGLITYSGFTNGVVINGGNQGNQYEVSSSPNSVMVLNTGAGADTVHVRATTGALNIDGNNGADKVNVGNLQGSLVNIAGAVSVANTSGSTTLNVDDSGTGRQRTGTITNSSITGLSAAINYGTGVSELNVRGGSGGNTWNVLGTSAATSLHSGSGFAADTVNVRATTAPLSIDGQSGTNATDTVNIGSLAPSLGGSLANIAGPVSVSNRSPSTLNVDDSGTSAARTGTITNSSITGLSAAINYGTGVSALNVRGGSGGNTWNVLGTSAATTLHSGSGFAADTVNVRATTAPLSIDGQAGIDAVDTVNIGSLAPSLGGSLANIAGPVSVSQNSGRATLNLDDSGDATARTAAIVTNGSVTGLSAPAAINYVSRSANGGIVSSLTIHGGSGGNTFHVRSTAADTPVQLNAGGGPDIINVGNAADRLATIRGPLTLDGQAASDDVILSDNGDPIARNYTLSPTALVRSDVPAAPISYANVETLVLNGSAGDNEFALTSTAFAAAITIDGGDGVNTLDYSAITDSPSIPGLVSLYKGEGNAHDSAGQNHGTIHGDVTFVPGRVGQAFDFDGDLDYVDLGRDASLDLPGSMSVSLWVRLDTLSRDDFFFGDNNSIDSASQGSLGTLTDFGVPDDPGRWEWYQDYTDGTFDVAFGEATPIVLHEWFHLAAVRDDDAKTFRLYVNGVEETSFSYPGKTVVPLQGNRLLGGLLPDFPTSFMDGQLDEVGIYNRALNFAEIQSLYNAPSVANPVSWYPGEGSAADSAGGNHGTIQGDVTFVPGRVGQAFDFDGVDDHVDLGSDASLDLPGSMSVSLWVRLDTLDNAKYFLADFLPDTGNTTQGSLGTVADGTTFAWVQAYTDGTFETLSGVTPIVLDQWFHLAAVRDDDAKTVRLYVNGVEESSLDYAGKTVVPLQGSKLLGGSGPAFPNDFMDGQLDEVSIYSRALSFAEIQALNSDGSAANSSGVVVNLPLGTASGLTGGISRIQNVVGSAGDDILVGNGGNVLSGGTGRDLLIAGIQASTLNGGDGEDILIAGWTDYDTNTAALMAIRSEWTRTDIDYRARVANLTTGNGAAVPKLTPGQTVFNNGGGNTLSGGLDALDLYFALIGRNVLDDEEGETVVPI